MLSRLARAPQRTYFLAEKAEPGDDRSIIPDIGNIGMIICRVDVGRRRGTPEMPPPVPPTQQ
jgi:hypothetical protein